MIEEEIGLAKVVDLAEVRHARATAEDPLERVQLQAQRLGTMLSAVLRRSGRVRIGLAELEGVQRENGALDVKVEENGDLTVSYITRKK